MIELAQDIIGTQPILAIFLAIGVGYLVGQINLGGFSLGVGAVLFVGLAIGAFAPKSSITGPIGLTGLVMFLYGIGILYGRQFFEGMSGAAGIKYNLLALVACAAGLVVALLLGQAYGIKIGHTLGIYAGSMTSTATLQAALDSIGNKDPSIGYSVAYPFGVIGPILCFYFLTRQVKPSFPPKPPRFHWAEVTIDRLSGGITLAELIKSLPDGVQVSSVRQQHRNQLPDPQLVIERGDGLLITADREAAIAETAAALGHLEPGRISRDRADLSYQRFFVSKVNVTGVRLADLAMPPDIPMQVMHVRRYDVDLVPAADLMLEIGDRIGVLVPVDRIAAARAYFGDTVKSTAEFSYVSVGFGMVLGVLLGLVPVPIPGLGTVSLGIGGGPLIVALILGRLRRTGPISWVMPLPANIVLRNFGLTLFLAAVGINSGRAFVTTVAATGPLMLLIGAMVLLTTVAIVLLVGFHLLKIPFDDLLGIASGATGNPAIVVYASRMAPTERPDIGYAMIFPSATIVKVIAVQVIGLLFLGG